MAAGFYSLFRVAVVVGLLSGLGYEIYNFMFVAKFFKVQQVRIQPADSLSAPDLARELLGLKGRSIFSVSLGRLETELGQVHPEIKGLRITRFLPDKIDVSYVARDPVVRVELPQTELNKTFNEPHAQVADVEGRVFNLPKSKLAQGMPYLVAHSSQPLLAGIKLVQSLMKNGGDLELWSSSGSKKLVTLDKSGEISLYADKGTRVVWGRYEEGTFAEKYDRFYQVWQDLNKRSVEASYINLRAVPQIDETSLGGNEIVGRVIVRPILTAQRKQNVKVVVKD